MTNVKFYKKKNGQHYFMRFGAYETYRDQDFLSLINTYVEKLNDYSRSVEVLTNTVDGLSGTTIPFVSFTVGEKNLVYLVTELHNKRFE